MALLAAAQLLPLLKWTGRLTSMLTPGSLGLYIPFAHGLRSDGLPGPLRC
jgi:hypothetical protein